MNGHLEGLGDLLPEKTARVSMEVIVTIISKMVYLTYLRDVNNPLHFYRGHNSFTKYHGHPSNDWKMI